MTQLSKNFSLEEMVFSRTAIANNYDNAVLALKNNFRKDLKKKLEIDLSVNYNLVLGDIPKSNKISQLWIHLKSNPDFLFGVESFSGHGHKDGSMFVGLVPKGNYDSKYY